MGCVVSSSDVHNKTAAVGNIPIVLESDKQGKDDDASLQTNDHHNSYITTVSPAAAQCGGHTPTTFAPHLNPPVALPDATIQEKNVGGFEKPLGENPVDNSLKKIDFQAPIVVPSLLYVAREEDKSMLSRGNPIDPKMKKKSNEASAIVNLTHRQDNKSNDGSGKGINYKLRSTEFKSILTDQEREQAAKRRWVNEHRTSQQGDVVNVDANARDEAELMSFNTNESIFSVQCLPQQRRYSAAKKAPHPPPARQYLSTTKVRTNSVSKRLGGKQQSRFNPIGSRNPSPLGAEEQQPETNSSPSPTTASSPNDTASSLIISPSYLFSKSSPCGSVSASISTPRATAPLSQLPPPPLHHLTSSPVITAARRKSLLSSSWKSSSGSQQLLPHPHPYHIAVTPSRQLPPSYRHPPPPQLAQPSSSAVVVDLGEKMGPECCGGENTTRRPSLTVVDGICEGAANIACFSENNNCVNGSSSSQNHSGAIDGSTPQTRIMSILLKRQNHSLTTSFTDEGDDDVNEDEEEVGANHSPKIVEIPVPFFRQHRPSMSSATITTTPLHSVSFEASFEVQQTGAVSDDGQRRTTRREEEGNNILDAEELVGENVVGDLNGDNDDVGLSRRSIINDRSNLHTNEANYSRSSDNATIPEIQGWELSEATTKMTASHHIAYIAPPPPLLGFLEPPPAHTTTIVVPPSQLQEGNSGADHGRMSRRLGYPLHPQSDPLHSDVENASNSIVAASTSLTSSASTGFGSVCSNPPNIRMWHLPTEEKECATSDLNILGGGGVSCTNTCEDSSGTGMLCALEEEEHRQNDDDDVNCDADVNCGKASPPYNNNNNSLPPQQRCCRPPYLEDRCGGSESMERLPSILKPSNKEFKNMNAQLPAVGPKRGGDTALSQSPCFNHSNNNTATNHGSSMANSLPSSPLRCRHSKMSVLTNSNAKSTTTFPGENYWNQQRRNNSSSTAGGGQAQQSLPSVGLNSCCSLPRSPPLSTGKSNSN